MNTPQIDPDEWLDTLQRNGYRVTAVCVVIVDTILESDCPLNAEQVWEIARQSRPETGRATVYRTIEKLESLGLLRRIHGYHGCGHFLPASPKPALLFVCLTCGYVDYLDYQPIGRLVGQAQSINGHHITDSRLQLFGICATCIQEER